jgi:steroid delta-isomerase-like uncharacterized protein
MEATMNATGTPTTQLDPAFVEQWSQRFVEAWNALDAEALAAMCSEDIVWHDPTLPHPARGPDDVRAFVTATAESFPDFRLEWRGAPYISPAEPIALIRNRITGTMRGPWSYTGLAATGGSIDVVGVDEFTFRGELLSHCRSYFDRVEMARQLGVLPPVGSSGERAMTRLQNLKIRLKRRGA